MEIGGLISIIEQAARKVPISFISPRLHCRNNRVYLSPSEDSGLYGNSEVISLPERVSNFACYGEIGIGPLTQSLSKSRLSSEK